MLSSHLKTHMKVWNHFHIVFIHEWNQTDQWYMSQYQCLISMKAWYTHLWHQTLYLYAFNWPCFRMCGGGTHMSLTWAHTFQRCSKYELLPGRWCNCKMPLPRIQNAVSWMSIGMVSGGTDAWIHWVTWIAILQHAYQSIPYWIHCCSYAQTQYKLY